MFIKSQRDFCCPSVPHMPRRGAPRGCRGKFPIGNVPLGGFRGENGTEGCTSGSSSLPIAQKYMPRRGAPRGCRGKFPIGNKNFEVRKIKKKNRFLRTPVPWGSKKRKISQLYVDICRTIRGRKVGRILFR